jgi:hypothetical protein
MDDISTVMPALVAGIHVSFTHQSQTWMAGTSPAVTWRGGSIHKNKKAGRAGHHARWALNLLARILAA